MVKPVLWKGQAMVGIYEERRSRAALWCQRFAVFLLPYFAIVIVLYRFSKIDTLRMLVLVACGLVMALLAIVFGLRAIVELWTRGFRGGSQVVRGLVITLLVLMPFGYYMFLGLQHPLANDVSTDTFNPPDYVSAQDLRATAAAEGVNPVLEYSDEYADTIVAAYPKLRSRRYPAGADRVLEAVRNIITENDWPITGSSGLPEPRSETDAVVDEDTRQQGSELTLDDNPQAPDDIYIEFVDRTPVFAFENDVVVRIVSEDENTLVDVRSSSRWGKHDFGYNARLIEKFLTELDTALLGIAGEG
jgi:hypothetical protein